MLGVLFANVFDAEIVHYQRECNWSCFMFEESVGVFCWVIPMLSQVLNEAVIRQASCLWQAIHSFSYLNVDVTMVDF